MVGFLNILTLACWFLAFYVPLYFGMNHPDFGPWWFPLACMGFFVLLANLLTWLCRRFKILNVLNQDPPLPPPPEYQ